MKKAFSTKLLALFVLVLTVATLAVVSSAANVWEAADGTGVVTTGDIAGAELAVVTTADNGDGTYTVVFDVNLKAGYMIDDADLHDGYIALEPVVIAKTHLVDGSFDRVVIEKVEKGDYAGYYVIRNWTTDCDIEVECVSPIVKTISGVINEDLTFEQDGHVYVLSAAANYANITVLNSKTDYTMGIVDIAKGVAGITVDDFGHIVDLNNGAKSYFASVYATGTFANMEGATLTFDFAHGIDDYANQSGNVAKANAIPYEVNPYAWFAGRFLIFGQSTADFYNYGTINVNARSVYFDAKNFFNKGTLNVNYGTATGYAATNLFINADFTNEGTVNAKGANIYVGGGNYKYSYNTTTHEYVASASNYTLTNKATINAVGTAFTAYLLDNKADAVITAGLYEYINPVTGKAATTGSSLALKANVRGDNNKFLTSKNAGKIEIVGNGNTGISVFFFDNSGDMSVTGDKVSGNISGLFTNSGNFVYSSVEADFEMKYTDKTITKASDFDWKLYTSIIYWSHINGRDGGGVALYHKNCAGCTPQDANYTAVTKDTLVRPFGIENTGSMSFKGITTGADTSSFKNNGAYIINKGEFTMDMEYRGQFTQFVQVEHNPIETGDWYNNLAWATLKNWDVENYGTLNLGGSVGSVIWMPYLYNYEGGIVNINGKFEVAKYDDTSATGQRMAFESGLVKIYDVDAELLNYGTVNVNAKGVVENWGDIINAAVINVNGIIHNFDWIFVLENGVVNNAGIINNGDADHVCDGTLVKCNHIGLLEIAGTVVNTNKLFNDWNSDIRIDKTGALDNVNGLLTNCGIIVNVGKFTTTVEGLDNQFAINGYDITYVNKAETEAPADDTTKAPAEDNADAADTKAPTKTPAAQTSDIAVAGLAIIATLSLAGVVVAKKVR